MIGATLDQPVVASAPDEVLMKHISRRRYDALAELYGRHSKRLRATIDGVVHKEAEADDVLQEIFIQVWEEAGRYSAKAGKPLGWMVTIARRRAIDRLRRRQAYSRARERYEKRVVQESQSPRRDAAQALVLNDLHKFLKKAFAPCLIYNVKPSRRQKTTKSDECPPLILQSVRSPCVVNNF